jgi:hypothetical protein
MRTIKLIVAGAALCGALMVTAASAMPVAPLSSSATNVEPVRWVCGPYGRCWWRPNYYYGGYYGYGYAPRPYYWRHRYWRHRHYW